MQTVNPNLTEEWNYEKNNGITPADVMSNSHKKAWWRCALGHEWQATIAHRNNGRGCPYCSGNKVLIGVNDLKTVNPDLAKEWNFEKNGKLTPSEVLPNSNKKIWWKCSKGHEWQSSVAHRNNGQGCPICSGKIILIGFNDLATTHPSLVEEWDFEKNKKLLPTKIGKGSEKKIWWICNRGHSWSATVYSRVVGFGCPHCAKELQSSFPEKAIFFYIKRVFPDAIANYRSNQMDLLELDVFIPSLSIGIEYDGERWHQNIEKDMHKNKLCNESGIVLIRIREPACPVLLDELSICIFRDSKKTGLDKTIGSLLASIGKIANIECTIDIDLERDNAAILELLNPIGKENNILLLKPDIANEWDYQKNGDLLPNMVTIGSDKKIWWICPIGHSYLSSVSSRVRGRGCPVCSGKTVLKGYNDFSSRCPELLTEWDYEKNAISPDTISYGSDKKVWWKCDKGHSYATSINNKRAGTKCPYCSGRKK